MAVGPLDPVLSWVTGGTTVAIDCVFEAAYFVIWAGSARRERPRGARRAIFVCVCSGRKESWSSGNLCNNNNVSRLDHSMRASIDDDRCAKPAHSGVAYPPSSDWHDACNRVHSDCSQLPIPDARARWIELFHLNSPFVCSLSRLLLSYGSCKPTPFRNSRPRIQPSYRSPLSCAILAGPLV
jgi:hypothetical protein